MNRGAWQAIVHGVTRVRPDLATKPHTHTHTHTHTHIHTYMGFPCGSAGKESTCNAGYLGSIPGLGRSPEGKGYPLQYSGLGNSMDCIVQGVARSWT